MPDLSWSVYAMMLASLGLVLVAAIYKTLNARAAHQWSSTPGKVTVSTPQIREVRVLDSERESGHRIELRNFANIVFEYSVGGQMFTGNRVSIGENRGDFQVAETLAKYPAGANVTVYYKPSHPHEAVLERDLPQELWGCLGIGMAVAMAIIFGAAIGLKTISQILPARLPNPQASVPVVALAALGLVVALFALVLRRRSARARAWPVVPGTIKLSSLEEHRTASDDSGKRGSIVYERKVSYVYRFNDIAYGGVHASYSSHSSTPSRWVLWLFGMDIEDGAIVKVWVNPDNPSEATLNPRTPFGWLLWLIAFVLWAAAYLIATAG